jgi:hypothetical protein
VAVTQINGAQQVKANSIGAGQVAASVIVAAGTNAFTADQSLGGFKLTNVGAPTGGGDAANKTYVDNAVVGLFDYKGGTDASANPNYPAAVVGDTYRVTVAGKVGGASGKSVDVGDVYLAVADNAGGNEATVGTSWIVIEHNLVGALLASNNLSDLANAGTARANLGLAIGTDVEAHDPTLTAFAALTITASSLTIGTGADAFSQTTFAANTFPARASSGSLVAKTITDFGLSLVDDADAAAGRATLGATTAGGNIFTVTNPSAITFLRVNADNTVTLLNASDFRTAIGATGGTTATRETPSGTVNGSNPTFTLANTPVAGSEMVFVNGVLQESGAGTDYTISGATLTFLTGAIPLTGDRVRVTYVY